MKTKPTFQTADKYAEWLNERLGAEVRRRREALGLSAGALARDAGVCDQTLLNLEQGACKNGCLTGTLARIAFRFGTTAGELTDAAEEAGEG